VSAPAFLVLALLTIAAALMVVLHRNPVYSALGLVATLFFIAVFFLGLDAHLVGFLQIIVYAGAIVVLFLFVIMLLNLQVEPRTFAPRGMLVAGGIGGALLAALIVGAVLRAPALTGPALPADYGGTEPIATRLFTSYLLPFELTSVLLLVAIVGAVVLGRKREA
jgi:NADH-quinone oxidoreductase subunit J